MLSEEQHTKRELSIFSLVVTLDAELRILSTNKSEKEDERQYKNGEK